MKYFSKALSIKLKEQNMTQTELANLLNVKQQTVSRWITNTTEPDLETLKQICTILSETPSYMLGFDDLLTDIRMR